VLGLCLLIIQNVPCKGHSHVNSESRMYLEDFVDYELQRLRDEREDELFDMVEDEEVKQFRCKVNPRFHYNTHDVENIIDKLTLMLKFLAQYIDDLIADGLYGLRITQGILEDIMRSIRPENPFYDRLQKLTIYTKELADATYKKINAKKTPYDALFLKMMKKPHGIFLPWRRIHTLKHLYDDKATVDIMSGQFSEKKSDHCIALLLGSAAESHGRTCIITEQCKTMETAPHTSGYVLTHQFLYFLIGLQHGCRNQLEESFGGKIGLQRRFDTFAVNIAIQMLGSKVKSEFHLDRKLEQATLGSILGIIECSDKKLHKSFLHYISKQGCATIPKAENDAIREKKEDRRIGGCSQHTNALMTAYLASTLRFKFKQPSCDKME